MTAHPSTDATASRPRVEGDREQEILHAALDVLADTGYDRLTMDAVATAAKASKATLYRRWSTKQALVVDAVCSQKSSGPVPDTGTLRGDLIALYCGLGGFRDARSLAVLAAVVTAMARDEEFAETYRRDFIAPKIAASRVVFDRALERGEINDHVDVALLAPALPGIVLHRVFLLGEEATPDLIAQIIDQIIIPAATCPHLPTASD
ncbi:TetR/AcrR family transcriptional regulator C-terminal ligand-binding domain-containing protein [Nocardioides sp.]|uniref:TetR/AcrR family transcriptional regulator n=1 Tax=Nocardioides sp. TaxID=35761 RepID=UPI00286EAED2|nr:TetR/AcrR family transcriptional regulator C-terminal ligand-binding domain-containing protein [Nocardioides sp.]